MEALVSESLVIQLIEATAVIYALTQGLRKIPSINRIFKNWTGQSVSILSTFVAASFLIGVGIIPPDATTIGILIYSRLTAQVGHDAIGSRIGL